MEDIGDCIRYKSKASDLASQLLNELGKTRFEDYAMAKCKHVKELSGFDETARALEAISSLKCERPCRQGDGGCTDPCEIARCVLSKGIEGCWRCNGFEECDKFESPEVLPWRRPKRELEDDQKIWSP